MSRCSNSIEQENPQIEHKGPCMSSIVFYKHKLPHFHSMRRERADGKGHSQAQDEQLLNLGIPPRKPAMRLSWTRITSPTRADFRVCSTIFRLASRNGRRGGIYHYAAVRGQRDSQPGRAWRPRLLAQNYCRDMPIRSNQSNTRSGC